jgi:hypothetical protein
MKLSTAAATLIFCLSTGATSQLQAPRPGFVRYPDGFVASALGLPGNFVLRGSPFAHADAASFSDQAALLSRNGLIFLLKSDGSAVGEYRSGELTPLLSLTGDLSTAMGWLPHQHELLYWTGAGFATLPLSGVLPQGAVSSIAAGGANQAQLLITQPNAAVLRCVVSLATGGVITCDVLPGVQGPAFAQKEFVLFKDDHGLEVVDAKGSVRTLPCAASDLEFQRMSTNWVHIYSRRAAQHWVLRLGPDLSLTSLPAGHPVLEDTQ